MARTKQQARAILVGPSKEGGPGTKTKAKAKTKAKKEGLEYATVSQLRDMAKEQGVSLKGLTKKAQIIKALEGSTKKTTPKKTTPKKTTPKKTTPKTGAWLIDGFDDSTIHVNAPILENLKKNPYDISGWFGDWITDEEGDERGGKPLETDKDLWGFFDRKFPLELGDHSYFLIPDDVNKYAFKYFEILRKRS